MADENKAEARMLKNLVDFRKANHDIFFGGRFIAEFTPGGDNETVNIPNYQPTPLVMGAEWTDINGKPYYILVNMSDRDRKVTLPSGRTAKVAALSALKLKK